MARTPLAEKMLTLATAERDALKNTVARIEAKIAKHPLTEQLAATRAALAEAEATVAQLGAEGDDDPFWYSVGRPMEPRAVGMIVADTLQPAPGDVASGTIADGGLIADAGRNAYRAGPPTPRTTDETLPDLPAALDVRNRTPAP